MRRIALSDHSALGFDAKVSANFRTRHLDLPPADEPRENVARASIEVGGEECLWLELTSRIADEKPSNRHRRHAAAIPQRGAAFITMGGPQAHDHSMTVAARNGMQRFMQLSTRTMAGGKKRPPAPLDYSTSRAGSAAAGAGLPRLSICALIWSASCALGSSSRYFVMCWRAPVTSPFASRIRPRIYSDR